MRSEVLILDVLNIKQRDDENQNKGDQYAYRSGLNMR